MGLNIELVIGREYRIRRNVIDDERSNRHTWQPARLIGVYPNVVVFDFGPYREALKYCQLEQEVREL